MESIELHMLCIIGFNLILKLFYKRSNKQGNLPLWNTFIFFTYIMLTKTQEQLNI
jgi:hypothetical protein